MRVLKVIRKLGKNIIKYPFSLFGSNQCSFYLKLGICNGKQTCINISIGFICIFYVNSEKNISKYRNVTKTPFFTLFCSEHEKYLHNNSLTLGIFSAIQFCTQPRIVCKETTEIGLVIST